MSHAPRRNRDAAAALLAGPAATSASAARRPSARRRRSASAREAAMPADLRLALDVAVPMVEALEGRQLMDGVALSGSLVTLTGNTSSANNFSISVSNNTLTATVNAKTVKYANASKLSVKVIGGSAADKVDARGIANATTVAAGAGDDTVWTGSANDSVDAGTGADSVDGGAGYDTVANAENIVNVESGSAGGQIQRNGGALKVTGSSSSANVISVTLNAAARTILVKSNANVATYNTADVTFFSITGGSGADSVTIDPAFTMGLQVYGNAGNDSLGGGAGADSIVGGAGNDLITAGAGNDSAAGGDGNDSIDGGAGTDVVNGSAGTNLAMNAETVYNATKVTSFSGSTPTTGGTPTGGTNGGSTGSTNVTGAGIPDMGGAAPTAKITLPASTSVVAGEALHVDALSSTLNAGEWSTARVEWNFGDNGSQYNELVGFNAAHVYARAGTYRVTARVINENGKAAETTLKVTVAADTRPSIYVSAAGNDANDGSTTGTAVRTWARAIALLGRQSNVKVLFRRGDTFNVGATPMDVYGDHVAIASYGSGSSNPTLMYNGGLVANRSIIRVMNNVQQTTIQGLTLDSAYTSNTEETNMPVGIFVWGDNANIIGNTFLNVGCGVTASDSSVVGVLLQGNRAPSATGLRTYLMWNTATDVVLLDNYAVNSTREHIFRNSGGGHVLIYDNDFTNMDRSKVDPDDFAKSVVNLQYGSYFYVANNQLNGKVECGPLGISGMDTSQRTSYVVYEGNHLVGGSMLVKEGAEHVTIRSNILDVDGGSLISVDGYDTTNDRGVVDLKVLNNTGINDSQYGNFMLVHTPVEGITVLNNLYVAPNLTTGGWSSGAVFVEGSSLSSFTKIDGNNWGLAATTRAAPGGQQWVNDGYVSTTTWNNYSQVGTDEFVDVSLTSNYTPVDNGSTDNTATAVKGVVADYYGNYRDASDWTVGAVQA